MQHTIELIFVSKTPNNYGTILNHAFPILVSNSAILLMKKIFRIHDEMESESPDLKRLWIVASTVNIAVIVTNLQEVLDRNESSVLLSMPLFIILLFLIYKHYVLFLLCFFKIK